MQRPAPTPEPPPEPVDWEHLIGRVWLPRIFILVLLVGVLWGFKAAINAGYLTEPVRCALGVLASGVLLWFGERQIRNDRHALGQVLLGGAVSVLVLTTFAAHMLYGLLDTTPAFVVNVLTVGGGVFLAYRHRSEALAVLSMLGGFLVPFLVSSGRPNTVFFTSYEMLASIVFLQFAWQKRYLFLHYVSIGMFHLTALVFAVAVSVLDEQALAYGILAHHVLMLGLVLIRRSATGERSSNMMLFTSAMLTIAWWCGLIYRDDVELYKGFLMALTLGYAALAVWRRVDRQQLAVFVSVAAFSLMIYLFNVLQADFEGMALLIEGALTLALAYYLNARLQLWTGWMVYLIGVCLTLSDLIDKIASSETVAWLLLLISVLGLYAIMKRRSGESSAEDVIKVRPDIIRLIGVAFAVLLLAFLTMITDVLAEPLSPDGEHMAVSFVWAAYAIAAIIFGTIRKSQFARLAGVVLLFVTLLKLIFVDLPTVSVVVRAILFIGLGVMGVGISRLFYQKKG